MAKFTIYKRVDGQFGWRLRAANNEIIATGEGYQTRQGAKNGIAAVQRDAPSAEVIDNA